MWLPRSGRRSGLTSRAERTAEETHPAASRSVSRFRAFVEARVHFRIVPTDIAEKWRRGRPPGRSGRIRKDRECERFLRPGFFLQEEPYFVLNKVSAGFYLRVSGHFQRTESTFR